MKRPIIVLSFLLLMGMPLFLAGQELTAADAHLDKGLEHYNAGRHKEAVQSYKEAVRLAPENPNGHFRLGNTYFELEPWKEAVAAYHE